MSNNMTQTSMRGVSQMTVGRFTYGVENIITHFPHEGSNLHIGSFCSIARNMTIFLGGDHRTDWISTFPFGHIYQNELSGLGIDGHPASKGSVVIGNDVWAGMTVTIMSGICIGDGAIIAANTHVVKDVPAYSIVGGNPSKVIKQRFSDEIIDMLLQLKWWDLPLDVINQIVPKLCSQPDKDFLKQLISTYNP